MLGMDVFNTNAFRALELTTAMERIPYRPTLLQTLGIFEPKPVRTETIAIENRDGALSLVATTPRGAPLARRARDRRQIRDFRTVRVALGDTLNASELQNIRAFGTMTELEQLQEEVLGRLVKVRDDVLLTHENMRLGAVQGIVLDADGSTLFNWYDEFNITQATEIDFDLDNASPASGAVRRNCNAVIRAMHRAAKGAWIDGRTEVHALCGDAFWDDLTAHAEVRQTYLNWQAAADIRNGTISPFQAFRYGDITWHNYRGTDDGSTVAVGTNTAKFFPVGAREVFQHAMSPGESFDFVNTPGLEFYSMVLPDTKRNAYVDLEVYSYPLMICSRPEMLQRARRT